LYEKILSGIYETITTFKPDRGGEEQIITSILAQIMRLKQVCAIDKAESTADLAVELYDSSEGEDNRKVLVFSQFKAVAYRIAQHLGSEALCFVTRNGNEYVTANAEERDKLVQAFQNDPKWKFLVVTEKTTKEGHNITAAGSVIFNDLFWTPAAHEQAEGRAYGRLSNLHSISSYYHIVDYEGNGIEEWIWKLLDMKRNVIEAVVEGVETSRDTSVAKMLIEKLKENIYTRRNK
jgi:SNF2 family DNA or RNA helicase